MFTVNFYASCFVSRGNSIGKKFIRLDWEKAVYRSLFTLANTLCFPVKPAKFLRTPILKNTYEQLLLHNPHNALCSIATNELDN